MTAGTDHFIFGSIIGFAPQQADVVHLYLLQDGQLYADAMTRPDDPLAFHPTPLDEEAFQLAIRAWTDFPPFLWNQPNAVFGCPDCADQGTLVVMTEKDGQTLRWSIDPYEWDLPEELRPYASLLKEILNGLP